MKRQRQKKELKEEKKTVFIKTTKSAKYIDPQLFHQQVEQGMLFNQEMYKEILSTKDKLPTIEPKVEEVLLGLTENLFQRLMHRASMFAMHRLGVTKEDLQNKKRLEMEPVLADFELAWKTLEMDAN